MLAQLSNIIIKLISTAKFNNHKDMSQMNTLKLVTFENQYSNSFIKINKIISKKTLILSLVFHCIVFSTTFSQASTIRCENLFNQSNEVSTKKFLKPSVEITPSGKIITKLTEQKTVIAKLINSLTQLFHRPVGLSKIETITTRLAADQRQEIPFWVKLSDAFGLNIQVDPITLIHVPRTGPLLIVSNHPMNGVDGVALASVISKIRPDVKIIMTPLLSVVPQVAENAIFANPYGGSAAKIENVKAREQMEQHLRKGGAIIIFPAGTVSGKNKLSDKEAEDGLWRKGAYDLVTKVPETQVLPIFVEGGPSQNFHRITKFNELLPKSLKNLQIGLSAIFHIREIASRIDQEVHMVIGKAFQGAEIKTWGNAAQVMHTLKRKTYELKKIEMIAPPGDKVSILTELKTKAKVIYDMDPNSETKRMKVYIANGKDIPETLNELSRLREITFRQVGEGTGKSRDLDDYDLNYYHLIVVDKATGDIAGAYRMGLVDKLLQSLGLKGLYTHQFFDLSKILTGDLLNSIELGRSFVTPEFQRSFALLALFNAIGRFIVENPQYKYLLGPVSISNEITDRSKALIMEYVLKYHSSDMADSVQALNISDKKPELNDEDKIFIDDHPSMKDLSTRVKETESSAGKKGATPPLIPIYISLGAKFFKFNFDKDFNTYDGLILTDLTKLSPEQLKLYMSEDGADGFLEYHRSR